MPRSSAASVGRSPAAPTSALSTTSGAVASISSPRSALCTTLPPPPPHAVWAMPRAAACSAIASAEDPHDSPTASRSGAASITWRAWTPIDPVEPSTRTRVTASSLA